MTEVVSVRFKNKGKVYFFDPAGVTVEKGMSVIVETSKGLEYAECARGNHMVEDTAVVPPLRPVIRIATAEDDARAEENRRKEKEAFAVCSEKIAKHGLEMKLVDVEYNFEGSKILFFFTSDGRVDFRDLVKDLASVFKTRIELRQIGVRDEARMLSGLGICGRPFCCAQFLDDFQPVSIKMAKTQGLSLNPTKISGTCGRLMCCLKYEQEAYEELVKAVPKVDSFVDTPQGKGMVTDVNLLRSKVRVRLEDTSDTTIKVFDADEVEYIGGKAARAEYLAAKAEGRIQEPEKKKETKKQERRLTDAAEPVQEKPAKQERESTGRRFENVKRPLDDTQFGMTAEKEQPEEEPTSENAPKPKNNRRNRRRKPKNKENQNAGEQVNAAAPQPQENKAAHNEGGNQHQHKNNRKNQNQQKQQQSQSEAPKQAEHQANTEGAEKPQTGRNNRRHRRYRGGRNHQNKGGQQPNQQGGQQ